ncbi:hypothetical protein GcM1_220027 [Golovinomyces cichoracearum]|uniref:Uncharacterized protein n=1 Tax=Golovinomyces cichoracearum TaxID=62708 RepID=A0A420IS06_9PEZI|nr:hypothetical protein GcM1_220027 [Golovinomyces cichoracearum]
MLVWPTRTLCFFDLISRSDISLKMEHPDPSVRTDQGSLALSNLNHFHEQHSKKSSGIIPRGTVASRVQHLQGVTNKKLSEIRSHIHFHSRENSSVRFGRQDSKSFPQPAENKAKPVKDSHYGTKKTSFLDLSSSRTKHIVRNASPSSRPRKHTNSSEADKDAKIPETSIKTQFKGVTPSLKIPTRAVSPCEKLNYKACDVNLNLKVIHPIKGQFSPVINCSVAPSDLSMDFIGRTTHGDKFQSRRKGSDRSISTTSTVRRQSVRDLFDKHRVERPSGLASSDEPQVFMGFHKQESYKHCHLCSCINKSDSEMCFNCKHYFCSRCQEAQIGILRASTERNLDRLSSCTPERSYLPLESESFIRKSQRSKPNLTQSNRLNISRELKQRSSINFSIGSSLGEKLLEPNVGIPKKSVETRKSAPFLSGKNVMTNVKNSPFLAQDMIESHGVSHFKSGLERTDNNGNQTLRHYTSCPKVHQKQNILERKISNINRDTYTSKNTELELNPYSDSIPLQQNSSRKSISSKPKFQTLKTKIGGSKRNTTDRRYSQTDVLPFLKEDTETDSAATTEQNLHERNLWPITEAFPSNNESIGSLDILHKAEPVPHKSDNEQLRTRSTSSSQKIIFDNYTKIIPSSHSPRTNDQQATKMARQIFKSPSPVLDEHFGPPTTQSLNHPRSHRDQKVSKWGTINVSTLNNTINHSTKDDLERKKKRRQTIANKIKQDIRDTDHHRSQNLYQEFSAAAGTIRRDSIHSNMIKGAGDSGTFGITDDHISSDTTAANVGPSVSSAQINSEYHGSDTYKRSSFLDDDDIPSIMAVTAPRNNVESHDSNNIGISSRDLPTMIGKDIKGVTVTLQLEGREELKFRAERLFETKNKAKIEN